MEEYPDHDMAMIEKYLEGRLEGDELIVFNARLDSNPEFKNRVNELRLLTRGIRQTEHDANLKFLKQLEESLPPVDVGKPSRRVMLLPWLSAAAAVSALVIISFLYFSRTGNSAAVFEEYFEPYPTFQSRRGLSADTLSDIEKGYHYYDQGRYAESINVLQGVLRDSSSTTILFYIANANLAQGNAEEAEKIFAQLSIDDSSLRTPCMWYMSLAHLKLGEKDEAVQILKKIREGNSSYSKKADDVLKKL